MREIDNHLTRVNREAGAVMNAIVQEYKQHAGTTVHRFLMAQNDALNTEQLILQFMTDESAEDAARRMAVMWPIVTVSRVEVPADYPWSPLKYEQIWSTPSE